MKKLLFPLLVTIVLSGCGSDDSPEPEVITKTITATVTKEVPVEKVVTKNVIPEGCTDALAAAEVFAAQMGEFSEIAAQWPAITSDALLAGYSQDIDEVEAITARMKELNARVEKLTPRVGATVEDFNRGKAGCTK